MSRTIFFTSEVCIKNNCKFTTFIPFHLISTSALYTSLNLLTLSVQTFHFIEWVGIEFSMGSAINIFQILVALLFKTNFNLRVNLKLHPNNITMVDRSWLPLLTTTISYFVYHWLLNFSKHSLNSIWLILNNIFSQWELCIEIDP